MIITNNIHDTGIMVSHPPPPTPLSQNTTTTITANAAATTTFIIPTPPDTVTCHRVNCCSRGCKYFSEGLLHLVAIIYCVKHIGNIEWEKVEDEHGATYEDRDVDPVRHKYTIMHWKKVPTGNPACPPEVFLAKS